MPNVLLLVQTATVLLVNARVLVPFQKSLCVPCPLFQDDSQPSPMDLAPFTEAEASASPAATDADASSLPAGAPAHPKLTKIPSLSTPPMGAMPPIPVTLQPAVVASPARRGGSASVAPQLSFPSLSFDQDKPQMGSAVGETHRTRSTAIHPPLPPTMAQQQQSHKEQTQSSRNSSPSRSTSPVASSSVMHMSDDDADDESDARHHHQRQRHNRRERPAVSGRRSPSASSEGVVAMPMPSMAAPSLASLTSALESSTEAEDAEDSCGAEDAVVGRSRADSTASNCSSASGPSPRNREAPPPLTRNKKACLGCYTAKTKCSAGLPCKR